MEYTLNAEKQLVDTEGNVIQVNGEDVTVPNAADQGAVDNAFKADKAAHQKKVSELTAALATLESQAGRSEGLQELIDSTKEEKASLETQVAELDRKLGAAEKDASDKVASQLRAAGEKLAEAEKQLTVEKAGRITDHATNLLLGASGSFVKPAGDVIPRLLRAHKQEPELDKDGGETGKILDLFTMTHPDKDGKEVTNDYPAAKALEIFAQENPHLVKPDQAAGSGGSQFGQSPEGKEKPFGFAYGNQ